MIAQKTKVKQLKVQARASLRLVNRAGAALEKDLNHRIHPIIAIGHVRKLLSIAETMDREVHFLCDKIGVVGEDDDEKVINLLSSPDGERSARVFNDLSKTLHNLALAWDEGRSLARQQIEKYEPTPLTLRDRTMMHLYTAFFRLMEAHEESLRALLDAHYLQFWVWDGKFHFAGQAANAKKGA